jgi:hypothetical protein
LKENAIRVRFPTERARMMARQDIPTWDYRDMTIRRKSSSLLKPRDELAAGERCDSAPPASSSASLERTTSLYTYTSPSLAVRSPSGFNSRIATSPQPAAQVPPDSWLDRWTLAITSIPALDVRACQHTAGQHQRRSVEIPRRRGCIVISVQYCPPTLRARPPSP